MLKKFVKKEKKRVLAFVLMFALIFQANIFDAVKIVYADTLESSEAMENSSKDYADVLPSDMSSETKDKYTIDDIKEEDLLDEVLSDDIDASDIKEPEEDGAGDLLDENISDSDNISSDIEKKWGGV